MTNSPKKSTADVPSEVVPSADSHIAFLDGLRAVAALWVLVGHSRILTIGFEAQKGVLGLLTNPALYLHFAVDIFIVLSGYCLILPVLRNNGGLRGGVRTFFAKRVRRILPTYYAALFFCLLLNVFIPYLHWARIRPDYRTFELPLSIWLTNGLLVQDIYPQFNLINGVFWSIAVEWHIYFLFPLLVWVQRRWGSIAALLVSGVGGAFLTYFSTHYHPILGPHYLFLFGMGIFAATAAAARQKSGPHQHPLLKAAFFVGLSVWLGILLVRWPIVDADTMVAQQPHFPLLDSIVGALTAGGLFVLATDANHWLARGLRNTLSWRPLVFLGSFSYSIYLFHIPFMTLLNHGILEGALQNVTPTRKYFLLAMAGLFLIIPACWGMFWLFERPFLTRRRNAETSAV